jgi:hypothetical protein
MQLQNQIGVARETPGPALRGHDGAAAGCPSNEVAFGFFGAGAAHAAESGLSVPSVKLPRCGRRIEMQDGMVNRGRFRD